MKKFLLIGNWKANQQLSSIKEFSAGILAEPYLNNLNCDLVICAAACYLSLPLLKQLPLGLGGQNVSRFEGGNFTGEVTASDLSSLGVEYCLVGHSERRSHFKEKVDDIILKINNLLDVNIIPILCLTGLEDIFNFENILTKKEQIVFCYEPTEYISKEGTFKKIDTDLIGVKMNELRSMLGKTVKLIYGGSVNCANIKEIASLSCVDGFLVGQASLAFQDFLSLAYELQTK